MRSTSTRSTRDTQKEGGRVFRSPARLPWLAENARVCPAGSQLEGGRELLAGQLRYRLSRIPHALVLILFGAVTPLSVLAEPGTFDAGPFRVQPSVSSEFAYDDNIFRAETSEQGSTIISVAPELRAFLENGPNRYEVYAAITSETYAQSRDDDSLDVDLGLDLHHEFSRKQMVDVYVSSERLHEDRGDGLNRGGFGIAGNDAPVEFDQHVLGARYTLGNNRTFGRLVVEHAEEDRTYQNFEETTAFFDRRTRRTTGTLYYNLSGKTALLVEGRQETVAYDRVRSGDVTLDAEEFTGLVGVAWEATAKTSGYLKWGYYDRDFDAAVREDSDDTRWDVAVTWAPRSYSTFTFTAAQSSDETQSLDVASTGDFIERDMVGVRWDHTLSARTRFSVEYQAGTDDYAGSLGRQDDRTLWSASLTRILDRWISVKASYEYEQADSKDEALSYERNRFFVGVDMTL